MSLVEDYSHIAVVEMLSVLKRICKHCGPEFQITSKTINKMLTERFGITYQGKGRWLIKHVTDTLLERGVLTIWDRRVRNKNNLIIYQVQVGALLSNV